MTPLQTTRQNGCRYLSDPHSRLRGFVPRVRAEDVTDCAGGDTDGVESISKTGEIPLTDDVTLSEGTNISLTQVGENIEIASTASGVAYGDLYWESDAPCALPDPFSIVDVGTCDAGYVKVANVSEGESAELTLDGTAGTITIPAGHDGIYVVQFSITYDGGATPKLVSVHVNDTFSKIIAEETQQGLDAVQLSAEGFLSLSAGDVVDVRMTLSGPIAETVDILLFHFSAKKLRSL